MTDWDSAGVLPANPDTAVSRLSPGPLTLMAAAPSDAARLFAAPEGPRPDDPARIDVFGVGRVGVLRSSLAAAPRRPSAGN